MNECAQFNILFREITSFRQKAIFRSHEPSKTEAHEHMRENWLFKSFWRAKAQNLFDVIRRYQTLTIGLTKSQ